MTASRTVRHWQQALAILALTFCCLGPAQGQSPVADPPGGAAKPERATPRGRLPAHYKEIVTGAQRDKIYAIQAKYEAEIRKVEEALLALVKQRNMEIEQVLSPEQRQQLTKALEEARARTAARAAAREKEAKAAAAKPATPATAPE